MSKYIFIDIDGTLLDHKTGIPESAVYAIHEARSNGHKVFICTGRSKSGVDNSIIDIGFDGYIFSSGAVVVIDNKQLVFSQINSNDIENLVCRIKERTLGYNLEGYYESYLDPIAEKCFNDALKEMHGVNSEMARYIMNRANMVSIKKYDEYTSVINKISLFSYSIRPLQDLENILDPRFKMIIHEGNDDGTINAEIFLGEFSKATGIDLILEYYSDTLENTIGFGDSMNDIEMIRHCKIGICMGNGIDAAKRIANDVTDSVVNNGLYNSFRKYMLI